MRPIRLEIEGLRSFRARQVIDFTGRDYIAVIGDTGAGKSSILEALTFALFGRTTFSGQGHQELMNASSTVLRVVFAFAVGGERWEAARILRRSGKGQVATGPVSLEHLAEDGSVLEKIDKAREMTLRVETVLGLDVEAFLRTVVLPQGQFSRLLVDDDQKQRSSVLRQIWRTDELTAAGAMADAALRDLGPLQGRVEQALAAEPDDPRAHLRVLDAAADRSAEILETARMRHRIALEEASTLAASAKEVERCDRVAVELSKWDGVTAASTAQALVAAASRSDAALADVGQAADVAANRLAKVPDDEDGYGAAEISRFAVLLQQLPALADQRNRAGADAVTAAAEVASLACAVDVAVRATEEVRVRLAALQADRSAMAAAAEAARVRRVEAASALAATRRTHGAAAAAAAEVQTAEGAMAARRTEMARAEAVLVGAQHAHDAAARVLDDARRSSAAGEAAHGLHTGDACPVCDQELPEGWQPPIASDLEAARGDASDAAARMDVAKQAMAASSALTRSAEDAAAAARAALKRAEAEASSALEALAARWGNPVDLERSDSELLADDDHAAAASEHALQARDETIEREREAHTSRVRDQARTEAAHRAKAAELAGLEGRREQAIRALRDQVAGLPPALRPTGEDLAADVDRALAALEERREVLRKRQGERDRLRREADELRARRRGLEQERVAEVDEPAGGLWTALAGRAVALERAAADLAEVVTLPPTDTRPALGELPAMVDLVNAATNHLATVADAASTRAQAAAGAALTVLAGLAADLGLGTDDHDRTVATIARAVEDATFEERTARTAADAFRRRLPAVEALKEAAAALDVRILALTDLAAALRDGAFPKWLTLRRSRSLLVHASRLLAEITAGRYAFADLADADSQWFVFDRDHGQPRSPSSLSGGEKFVASLALALGMVEMMGRQGDRIGSLFLDEGFGALDRTNLDAAVEALASVAATGRMVAVITHLRAVAEQIDDVLSVTCEATGTNVAWLDASARSALSERELSVRGGLLE